jgi:signal transduction histidine kinase
MHSSEDFISNKDTMSPHLGLKNLGEEIMSTWEARVRNEVESAGNLLRPALRDALPKFLSLLAEALSEKESRGLMEEGSDLVREHAGDRARESGFGPSQIVQELQLLRDAVTSRLEREVNLSTRDYETIQKTFDQAIQEALMEFFLVHAQLREQFMATLSHDLRNPIGVARMGASLIQDIARDIQDSSIQKDLIDLTGRIIANMKRADRMIQDLLDASILRIGEKLPVHISKCDLLTIACDVVTEFDEQEKKRIQIIGSPMSGYWDCEGLKRSLENLVKNAIKYGAAGTPITVKIVRTTNGHVCVSVHNHGNPIPEQDQKLIFRAFGRSKSAQNGGVQGWGIGLALVRGVSESLGGSASLESSKEAGTTFVIDLPEDSRGFQISSSQMH